MKIDKAIKILDVHQEMLRLEDLPDLYNALQLGIEALKRLKEHREEHIDITFRALPGETED